MPITRTPTIDDLWRGIDAALFARAYRREQLGKTMTPTEFADIARREARKGPDALRYCADCSCGIGIASYHREGAAHLWPDASGAAR